jgi:hypothetical protein
VLGPEGEHREFDFGGSGAPRDDERRAIRLHRGGGDDDGDGGRAVRLPEGRVRGKVIIIGPGGERREFDLNGDGPSRDRAPRIRIEKFRDGGDGPAHQEDEEGKGPSIHERVIEVRKVSGGATL